MTIDLDALPSCPFCGYKKIKICGDDYYFYADCAMCEASGPSARYPDDARAAWKNRVLKDPTLEAALQATREESERSARCVLTIMDRTDKELTKLSADLKEMTRAKERFENRTANAEAKLDVIRDAIKRCDEYYCEAFDTLNKIAEVTRDE